MSRKRRLAVSLVSASLLAGFAAAGHGEAPKEPIESFDVLVAVDWQAGSTPGPAAVVAKPLMSDAILPKEVVNRGGGRFRLRKGAWSISLQRPGFWAPTEVVVVVRPEQSVRLSAWPTGTVRGRFREVPAEVAAGRISLGFAASPGSGSIGPPAGVASCALEHGQWSCDVPAAKLDLQLSVPGFATRYEWDREVKAAAVTDLGHFPLTRGGSVVGWIEDARGAAPGQDATVSLSGSEPDDGEIPATSVKCNRRGFFQIVGVRAGGYRLEARKPAMATSAVMIRVALDTETRLAQPIVLALPGALSLSVDPPLGPDESAWTITVLAIRDGIPSTVTKEVLARTGRWRRADLAAGRYHVTVSSGEDQQWWGEEVVLESGGSRDLAVQLQLLTVRGTVALGDRPLPEASVSFGGALSPVRLTARSDSRGRFSIRLPRPGGWAVSVEVEDPRIHRDLRAEVETTQADEGTVAIVLDDTALSGYVRDEAGSPLAAHVQAILDGGADAIVITESNLDGAFELRGLPVGAVTLVANARGGLVSAPVSARVAESKSERSSVELIVRRPEVLRGVVFSSEGGVPRARVAAFPLPLGSPVMPVMTDDEGRFEARVPAGTSDVVIAISAIGYGYKVVRHSLVSDDPVLVLLDGGGGTLRILLPEPEAALNAFVLHDGGFSGLMALRRWAVQNGAGAQLGAQVVVPRMPSGLYVACLGGRTDLEAALLTRPSEGCVAGTLPDGGDLELRLAP